MLSNEELIKQFGIDCNSRNFSKKTCKTYILSAKAFADRLEGQSLLQIDSDDLIDYINYLRRDKQLKEKSIDTTFCAISALYDFFDYRNLTSNPCRKIRQRYLHQYKEDQERRKIISIQEASALVNKIISSRDRAMVLLLLKTGIRIAEMISLDISDIDWKEQSIELKPTHKRTNRTVFFDNETKNILTRWMMSRETWNSNDPALFLGKHGRVKVNMVEKMFQKYATMAGLHNQASKRLKDRLSPHCCRHWFTTVLMEAGMRLEDVQVLRGDKLRGAIGPYYHPNMKKLQQSYLAHMPILEV
jgi:integrase/recombinase XerD